MTGQTPWITQQIGLCCLAMESVVFAMTEAAILNFFVRPDKVKARLRVIEIFCVECDQSDIFSLMLDMTGRTILSLIPMVSPGGRYPLADFRVAFEASTRVCLKLICMTCQTIF